MSSLRTTTYHYDSKKNKLILKNDFDRLTIAATSSSTTRSQTPELGYYSSPSTTPNSSPLLTSPKMAKVSFGPTEGAREPLHDEREVMRSFHKHVKHCETCSASLSSWRSGQPLCSRGHNYVVDMRPSFLKKVGKVYSMIDRNQRDENNRILVPSEYKYVTTLFEALNAGYATSSTRQTSRPKQKPVVHHSTAEVVYREPQRSERPTIVIPATQYSSPRSSRRSEEKYHEERRYREPRSRGSLYPEDEKRRHRGAEEVIYVTPRSPRSPRYHLWSKDEILRCCTLILSFMYYTHLRTISQGVLENFNRISQDFWNLHGWSSLNRARLEAIRFGIWI